MPTYSNIADGGASLGGDGLYYTRRLDIASGGASLGGNGLFFASDTVFDFQQDLILETGPGTYTGFISDISDSSEVKLKQRPFVNNVVKVR